MKKLNSFTLKDRTIERMKKLNSFTLKDRTIERMKNMIDQTKKDKKNQTKKDKKEREFDFCNYTKNNVLLHMNECIGNECYVASRRICVKGEFVDTYIYGEIS